MNEGYRLTDLERRLNNLLMLGTILDVDHTARKLRVEVGDIRTAWLEWPVEMGRNFRRWRPLRKGQQVLLSSPSGDPSQAVISGMLYTSALSAPSDNPDLDLIEFEDGAQFQYDSAGHHCKASTPASGKITLQVGETSLVMESGGSTLTTPTLTVDSQQSTFTGAVTIQGALTYLGGMTGSGGSGDAASISGKVSVSGDVVAAGISLINHTHTGDSGGNTSRPK